MEIDDQLPQQNESIDNIPKCLIELEFWCSLTVENMSAFSDKLTELVSFWNVCNIFIKEIQVIL